MSPLTAEEVEDKDDVDDGGGGEDDDNDVDDDNEEDVGDDDRLERFMVVDDVDCTAPGVLESSCVCVEDATLRDVELFVGTWLEVSLSSSSPDDDV